MNDETAMSIGKILAVEAHDRLKVQLKPMNQRERILAFSKWLAVDFGHMKAAIGHEAARALVDTLKDVADGKLPSPEADDAERHDGDERGIK